MVAKYSSSYIFAGSTSATETGPLRVKVRPFHGLRRTVTRGRDFERKGLPRFIKTLAFADSCVCSVQVCGFDGVWNFRFEEIPQTQVFFKGTRQVMAVSTPSSLGCSSLGPRRYLGLAPFALYTNKAKISSGQISSSHQSKMETFSTSSSFQKCEDKHQESI